MRRLLLPTTLVLCALSALGIWWLAPQLWAVLACMAGALLLVLVLAALNPSWGCYGAVITRGSSDRPLVALTFDDGPDAQHTRAVLDALDAAGAKGTFFMVGEKVRREPQLVREVHERGHQIGHHSERHDWRVMLSPRLAAADLVRGDAAFASVLALRPRFFRPPIGLVTPELLSAVDAAGMLTLLWSVRSRDGVPISSQKLTARVLDQVGAGDIVLLHDVSPAGTPEAQPAIVGALPEVLDGLAARGLQAVTVSELLGEPAYFADSATPSAVQVPRRSFLAKAVAATFALLFLAAGASAFAASTEPQRAVEEAADGDLPASFVVAAKVLAGHSSVSARFIQSKRSQWFVDEVVQRGLLRLRTQDRRLLWSYDEGAQLLLAEGTFYSLNGRGGSGAGARLPPMASRMAEMMGALFFMRIDVIKEHFRVLDEGNGWFLLRARGAGPKAPFREVRLQIGGKPLALQQVVLEEKGGDVTRIELVEMELGLVLPAELFRRPGEEVKAP